MSPRSLLSERLQKLFQPTPRGVVGLVEDLLGLCREQRLRFDLWDSHCYVRALEADKQDAIDVPLQKSVFRAVLARIAALCNERVPNSVTPYHGEGELSLPTDPPTVFRAAFTNTPNEQRLELKYLEDPDNGTREFTVLLRDNRVITVHGHALKYVRNISNPTDCGSYGVLSRFGGADVLVALFPVSEVTGVFSGALRGSQESA